MKNMRKATLVVVLTAAVLALALTGCAPVAEPESAVTAPAAAAEQVLTRAMTSEPANIDPQGAPSSGLSLVMPYLFDTLVVRDLNNEVVPLLAESWEVAEDGKSISMRLKEGVTFQDGTTLNAEAVRITFERFKAEGLASPIYGGVEQIAGVEVVDDLTVRFLFEQPTANFWSTISMPYAGIISPESIRKVAEAGEGHLVGSGPFTLADWQSGQSITLARNPDYAWGPALVENQGAPYLDKMVFKVIPDATTQLAALEAGEVDVVFINQPSHYQQLAQNPEVTLHESVLNSLIYLGFNTQKAPFDEKLVRQALSHAVDKDAIVTLALGGLGEAAFAPLPPTLPGFDPALQEHELATDVEQAKALLQEAGFSPTADGGWERDGQPLRATLVTSNRPPNESVATLLQSQLQAIGVPVEILQLDGKAVMDAAAKGEFDLLLWRYDWNDPDALAVFLGTERVGSTNRVAYSNPAVDDLLALGAHELNDDARWPYYVEAQKIILDDAPWQPLYNPVDVIAIRSRIQGAEPGFMGRLLVNDAKVVGQ